MNMRYNANKSQDVYSRGDPCGRPAAGRPENEHGGYNTNESKGNASGGHAVNCPYCGSTDTELFSLFGSQLLTVQYYCNNCHTPFERVKDDDVLNAYDYTRKEGQP